MTKRRNKKFTIFIQKIVLLIFVISFILYFGYNFQEKFDSSFLKTHIIQLGSIEKSIKKDAVIIREEEPIKMKISGDVTFLTDSGARVAKNQVVAMVNTSSTGFDAIYSLKVIEKKLSELESGYQTGQVEYSEEYINSKINSILSEIQYRINNGDKNLVSDLKIELDDMIEKGRVTKGVTDIQEMTEGQLREKKRILENQISESNSVIKSPMAGLLSSYHDEYGELFSIKNMMDIKASDIANCKQNVSFNEKNSFQAGEVCSYIVNNHGYYFATELTPEDTEIIKRNKLLTIKVDAISVPAYFYDFYQDEDGKFVGFFDVESDAYNFLANRKRPIEICYEEKKGILIPNNAIVEKDGKTGVFVIDTAGRACFKMTGDIILKDEDNSLVNFDYDKINDSNILKLYDEIILSPKGIEEMQKVR